MKDEIYIYVNYTKILTVTPNLFDLALILNGNDLHIFIVLENNLFDIKHQLSDGTSRCYTNSTDFFHINITVYDLQCAYECKSNFKY